MDQNNQTVTDPSKIPDMQRDFYASLYTSDRNVDFQFKNNSNSQLTPQQKSDLDEPITIEELTTAVKSLKQNKAGGLDGFSFEFYQFFWSKIKNLYHQVLQYTITNGEFHKPAITGLITLIPKKDKDLIFLKNWRPLTMLSIDYKILAKALATRIKQVLPDIISESRSGFMEKRQISLTLRTTLDITKDTKNFQGYVLLLDLEKCFDRIEYEAICQSLRYFNFGEKYIGMVKILLNQFQSCTTNNGFLSETFKVSRSCHQGCNLAPYLYLICGKVMAQKIKEKSSIKGIKFNDLENIIAQFPDDTQLFLQMWQAVENAITCLTEIEKNIGLKVNYEKSCIVRIGNAQHFECSKPLVWDPGGITVLGIKIQNTENQYWDILVKAKNILKNWYYRELTLIGKVLVNTLVISLFVYIMQVAQYPSEAFYQEFDKIIKHFLWKGKKAKIPIQLLEQSPQYGGLKLVNLRKKNTALKLGWLFRKEIYVTKNLEVFIPKEMGINFWDCSLNEKDVKKITEVPEANPFWAQLIEHWFQFTWNYCKNNISESTDIRNEKIWYNLHIKVDSQCLSNPAAAQVGMICVKDILNETELMTYPQIQERYGDCVTWYQYVQICQAIPHKWKSILRKEQQQNR